MANSKIVTPEEFKNRPVKDLPRGDYTKDNPTGGGNMDNGNKYVTHAELDSTVDKLSAKIDLMEAHIDTKFEQVNTKFETVNTKFATMKVWFVLTAISIIGATTALIEYFK